MNRIEKSVVFAVLVVLVALGVGFFLGGKGDGSVLMSPSGSMSWVWFPLIGGFAFAGLLLAAAVLAFWVWMLVDCAGRKFKENVEKIVWLLVVVLGGWVGAVVYFIVIRAINKHGIL